MFSTPRERSTSSVGAATEKGTSRSVSSRLVAVTVTASLSAGCSTKSRDRDAPPATSAVCVTRRKPRSVAATL
jgi:hypothetical protein